MIKNIFYGWWIVLACSLVGFYVVGVIFYEFMGFFEPIREEFGWSYTQISFTASLRGLEMGIFTPLVGFLVDRFGSRKLIFWGSKSFFIHPLRLPTLFLMLFLPLKL